MKTPDIVIDTNVLITALKSKRGASFKLFSPVGKRSNEFLEVDFIKWT